VRTLHDVLAETGDELTILVELFDKGLRGETCCEWGGGVGSPLIEQDTDWSLRARE
jgi:hypothetical protein